MKALVSLVVVLLSLTASASAQRRALPPPPVELTFAPDATARESSHRWVVSLRATDEVEVLADRRLLWLEVRSEGSRRALRCESPVRPRRADPSRSRSLRSGETWAEWLDIRSVCWGAALRAIEGGADVTAHFGSARWRATIVAHDATGAWRELVQPSTHVAAHTHESAAAGAVRVALADADVASGQRLSLRVSVRAGDHPVRAWVRPDRVRFRVVAPDGASHVCFLPRGGGAPIPDLFARLGTRRGATLALDARQFCGRDVFAYEGVYEVTPILDLDASGEGWGMDTPLGTFEGQPAVVRIRSGERGYVERPFGAGS
jgi:hypothetical protein